MKKYGYIVLKEVESVLSKISDTDTKKFISEICKAKRIYITGVGRSGLVVKAFGQRLMHLGFEVHLADEITAPGIAKGDILIACSGTGTTYLTLYMARKASKIGARVISLTASPRSSLSKYSKLIITIPAPLEHSKINHNIKSSQPARSLFEQVLFIYLDSIISEIIDVLKIRQDHIEKRHANLE